MIAIETVDKVLNEASASHKPALIFILGGDWCRWCVKLKEAIKNEPGFLDRLRREDVAVGFVQVDRKEVDVSGVRDRFGVKSLPYAVLVSPDGKIDAATEFIGDGLGEDEDARLEGYVSWLRNVNSAAL
jgi:thioredoxin-related protein